jgi:hypothetical protein
LSIPFIIGGGIGLCVGLVIGVGSGIAAGIAMEKNRIVRRLADYVSRHEWRVQRRDGAPLSTDVVLAELKLPRP